MLNPQVGVLAGTFFYVTGLIIQLPGALPYFCGCPRYPGSIADPDEVYRRTDTVALVMLLQGFAMRMVMVLRTLIITSHTSTEERGSGMGTMELGFSTSLILMPVLTAMLIESMPTENAFCSGGLCWYATV